MLNWSVSCQNNWTLQFSLEWMWHVWLHIILLSSKRCEQQRILENFLGKSGLIKRDVHLTADDAALISRNMLSFYSVKGKKKEMSLVWCQWRVCFVSVVHSDSQICCLYFWHVNIWSRLRWFGWNYIFFITTNVINAIDIYGSFLALIPTQVQ